MLMVLGLMVQGACNRALVDCVHSNYRQGFSVVGVGALNLRQSTGFESSEPGGWGLASPQRLALEPRSVGFWQRKCSIERRTGQLSCSDDRSPRREGNEDPVPSFVARRRRSGPGRVRFARGTHCVGCYPRDEELGERDQRRVLERGRQPHFRRHYLVVSHTTVLGSLEGVHPLQCPSSHQGARWRSGKSRGRMMRTGSSRSIPLSGHCQARLRVSLVSVSSDSPLDARRHSQRASEHRARPRVLGRGRQPEFPLISCRAPFLESRNWRRSLQWSECKPDLREGALSKQAPVNMAPALWNEVL